MIWLPTDRPTNVSIDLSPPLILTSKIILSPHAKPRCAYSDLSGHWFLIEWFAVVLFPITMFNQWPLWGNSGSYASRNATPRGTVRAKQSPLVCNLFQNPRFLVGMTRPWSEKGELDPIFGNGLLQIEDILSMTYSTLRLRAEEREKNGP